MEIKYTKGLNYVLNQKVNVTKTSSVRNIRCKYRRQCLPPAAVSMKQNHNTIDAIDHKRANS